MTRPYDSFGCHHLDFQTKIVWIFKWKSFEFLEENRLSATREGNERDKKGEIKWEGGQPMTKEKRKNLSGNGHFSNFGWRKIVKFLNLGRKM